MASPPIRVAIVSVIRSVPSSAIIFTFFFVLFLCSAEEAVSSPQPIHGPQRCAQAASRLVASGDHPKGLALMPLSTAQ